MAQTDKQELDFVVQESEVIFYYPKIVKAVGHDQSLFPFKKIEDAKNAKLETEDAASMVVNAQWRTLRNPTFQQNLEKAARSLLNSTKERIRSIDDAQRILLGFVQWMDAKKYKYVSQSNLGNIHQGGGMSDAKFKKLSHNLTSYETNPHRANIIVQNKYNVFASVSSPVGNCKNVADAFALLLFLNGFDKNTLKLCRIDGHGGENNNAGIFFKGEANRDLKFVYPSPKGLDAPTCELTGGSHAIAQCKQLYPKDADRPFDNHWIVKCGTRYYDPLYRCSYNDPDEAFDRIERLRVVGECTEYTSPARSVDKWGFGEVWRVTDDGALILEFESPLIQKLLGVSQKTAYIKYKTDGVKDDVDVVVGAALNGFRLPHGLGRVFGYCLPYDIVNLNIRLMRAVMEYEKGCTGIFRSASPESVQFCKNARVFCGQTETAPANRGKIYRPTDRVDWRTGGTWTQEEARETIREAIYGFNRPPLVGTTLRKCLWEAFGVPSFLRS